MNNNYVIMDYEKKYEEALERAKKWYYAPNVDKIPTFANRVIEEIFPELCESEDEKIRKALVDALNKNLGNGIEKYGTTLNAALTWLEKQGQPRMQHGITINGVEYELIEDHEADECERCALKGQCNNIGDDTLCNAIFGSDIVAHRRFEKKTK